MAHHEPKHDEHPGVYCHDVIQSSKPVHTYEKEWKLGRFPRLTLVHEHRRSCIRRLTLAAGLTVVTDCMSFSCASFCSGPQVKGASFLVKSVSGLAIFAKLGMKARRYPTTPRKLRMSFFPLSVRGHSVIPFIFAGSIATPFDDRFIPRKVISGAMKIDLLNLRWSSLSRHILRRSLMICICNSFSPSYVPMRMLSM